MNRCRRYLRPVATALIGAHLAVAVAPVANAGMVSAEQTMQSMDAERQQITNLLDRDDVRAQLQAHGVSHDAALERVAAMSDAEVAELARQFDQLPAGGSFSGLLLIFFFGWAILHATDYGNIFKGEEKAESQ